MKSCKCIITATTVTNLKYSINDVNQHKDRVLQLKKLNSWCLSPRGYRLLEQSLYFTHIWSSACDAFWIPSKPSVTPLMINWRLITYVTHVWINNMLCDRFELKMSKRTHAMIHSVNQQMRRRCHTQMFPLHH